MDEASTHRTELWGGVLLVSAALLAVVLANSPWSSLYDALIDVPFSVRIGEVGLSKPILLWINDGLMAVFFLLVGLELKGDFLEGEFRDPRRMVLTVAAALGGIALPVSIYLLCNAGEGARVEGWAIPAATDIAFAVGVLALLGRRIPSALRRFLLSLAVIDDIAAIAIIAVYYSDEPAWTARALALVAAIVLFLLNRFGVTRHGVYFAVGVVLWLCMLESGIHATLAGVVLGVMIPHRPRNALGHSPLRQLEFALRPWVAYVILPAFAFANAGVSVQGIGVHSLGHTVTVGIGLGLLVGKPLGVFLPSLVLVRTGLAPLPEGVRLPDLLGVAFLAGIGFTMSLFIGVLAFDDAPRDFAVPIRLGVLGASLTSGLIGLAVLGVRLRRGSSGDA